MSSINDFGIDSSLSPFFVTYGIYDEELAKRITKLLETHSDQLTNAKLVGNICVRGNVVSVRRNMGDIERVGYHIYKKLEDECDTRTEKQEEWDNKKALTKANLIKAFKGFFYSSFPTAEIEKLLTIALQENGVDCRVHAPITDGGYYTAFDFTCEEALKESRLEGKKALLIKKQIDQNGTAKDFIINDGTTEKTTDSNPTIAIVTPVDNAVKNPSPRAALAPIKEIHLSENEAKQDWEFKLKEEGTYILTKYIGGDEKVEIPTSIDGKIVDAIDTEAFGNRFSVRSVIISDSIISIGDNAFMNCKNLSSVTFGNNISYIGGSAFIRCDALTSIVLPDSVCSIGNAAFGSCIKLESVVFGNRITKIGCRVLENTAYAKNYAGDVVYVGEYLLSAKAIKGDYEIPSGVRVIADEAFMPCANIERVYVPESVIYIGKKSFYGCKKLVNVNIPHGVRAIEEYAFKDCVKLTRVDIPESVQKIESHAFEGCTGLESVTIPESVVSIGMCAFFNCKKLKSIEIPKSVTDIGKNAFLGCISLEKIDVSIDNQCYKSVAGNLYDKDVETMIRYAAGNKNSEFAVLSGIINIGDCAFANCKYLKRVDVSNSVINIGRRAFIDCQKLAGVTIPDSVTDIGEYAFENCKGLTTIELPNSITSISKGTFYRCEALSNVDIPYSVADIGDYVFYECKALKNIIIPDSVPSIGINAFYSCEALTSITIPDSVTSIGAWAFNSCKGLVSATIPDTVTRIEDGAFSYCKNLTIYTQPGSYAEKYAVKKKIKVEVNV